MVSTASNAPSREAIADSPSPDSLNQRVRPGVQSLHPNLLEWRRHLHQYPELGFRENLTAQFISHKLNQWGIDQQTGIAKTGIVATITRELNLPIRFIGVGEQVDDLRDFDADEFIEALFSSN